MTHPPIYRSKESMKNHKQSVYGAILGQAIGDAIGHPTEFKKELTVTGLYRNNEFTDDTQMMLAIGESILAAPPTDGVEQFMQELGENFIRWDRGDPRWGNNDRAPGLTCTSAVDRIAMGIHWKNSGATENGKGNGGAMRASIVGAAFWKEPTYAFQIGGLTSVNTHNNLESIMASAAVAFLVANAIKGTAFAYSMAELLELLGSWYDHLLWWNERVVDQLPDFAIARLAAAFALGKTKMTAGAWRAFNGNDFKGVEAVAAAIFYNTKYSNYKEVVLGLANNTGDSDTTSAIGGAIAGARWGEGMIPREWREGVEKSEYLHDLASRIWEYSDKFELKQTPASK